MQSQRGEDCTKGRSGGYANSRRGLGRGLRKPLSMLAPGGRIGLFAHNMSTIAASGSSLGVKRPGGLPPEILRPVPRKGTPQVFRAAPGKSPALKVSGVRFRPLYTEAAATDDRGWWPHRRSARSVKKGQPCFMADLFIKCRTAANGLAGRCPRRRARHAPALCLIWNTEGRCADGLACRSSKLRFNVRLTLPE